MSEFEGHTPGPWLWRNFGAHLTLVTAHGGAKVVLAPNAFALLTRCRETGVLRVLGADDPDARLIAAAPALLSRAERAERERDALREALVRCCGKFMEYADYHAAKGTPESAEKAKVNHDMVTMIDAALAQIGGDKP